MRKWIGLDVGGTTIKGAAVLENGTIVVKEERPTESEQGTAHMLDRMAEFARDLAGLAGWNFDEVAGVGVGVPAFIDFSTGFVERAVNLGWENVELLQELKKRLGEHVPIALENDANAAGLGETWAGGGKGFSDALFVTLGTGVGGGLLVDGKIVHGANGMAGEIGHITIEPNGRRCNCGRLGCLETISSATGILALAQDRLAGESTSLKEVENLSTRAVFEHAERGDRVAQEVVYYAIDRLGFALANIGCTLNPQVIVVGGGVSSAGDALLNPLKDAFARYALPRVTAGTAIRLAELGNDAGVIGAALLQIRD
ncbi:ROK family glucokinase [Tumebacillus permanentifrigoris]|uniref:Glucokinase n=1 Tax=Tumebacillus permanentifrigoris TaxID=378543 RepID=A0A316D9P7_9BACL|nr:ROK family glucokinase [Tumebacillus permanentifrigoris]PWK13363.1 glucokinase [Tumebacillus permanentifrigoris]